MLLHCNDPHFMASSTTRPGSLAHTVSHVSVAGRRGHNEDAVLYVSAMVRDTPVTLLAVADGMGGHAHGEVASELACGSLETAWPDFLEALGASGEADVEAEARDFFDRVFGDADRRIGDHVGGDGMGTTLTAALLIGQRALFANVGDSRGYIVRRDDIEQVTEDHSVVADALRRGVMTELEAGQSMFQHALTRSLDGSGDASPDLFPAEGGFYALGNGAIVLVCSDGLYGSLTELDLLEYVIRTEDLATACQALTAAALDRGSQDNVTIVTAEQGRLARAPDPITLDSDSIASTLGTDQPVEAGPPDRSRHTVWALVASSVLLFCVAVGLYTLSGSTQGTERNARQLILLPLTNPDSLQWTVQGGLSRRYVFHITVYDVATHSDEASQSVMIRAQRQALALSDIADVWPESLRAGTYRWRVDAFGASDTLSSEVGKLVLPRHSSNAP